MAFVQIEHIARRFGRVHALSDFSVNFPKNGTIAFVGSNGAGKTTTLSIIGGFLRADSGRVLIDGKTLQEYRASGRFIGLLPQDVQFYEDRTVWRQLVLFAALTGLRYREAEREAKRVLALVDLTEKSNVRVEELSRGMKVRMGTAQAMIGHPDLVLLDEPMAGLDPRMKTAFREAIRQLRGTTTLVISSHDLNELQELCDYACVIDNGRDVAFGKMDEFLSSGTSARYVVNSALDVGRLVSLVPGGSFRIEGPASGRWTIHASIDHEAGDWSIERLNSVVLEFLIKERIGVISVQSTASLESSYLKLLEGPRRS